MHATSNNCELVTELCSL